MKRFLILAFLGGTATLAGHTALSVAMASAANPPVFDLLQACAALVLGTACFASGMLGLAENHGKLSRKVAELLGNREITPEDNLQLRDETDLTGEQRRFWGAYFRTNLGVGLFLSSVLAVSLALASSSSAEAYRLALGAVILTCGFISAVLGLQGLARVRRSHVSVARTAATLDSLPERLPEPVTARRRRQSRYGLFRRRAPSFSRQLDSGEANRRHSDHQRLAEIRRTALSHPG
ncbi:MAG: hypothetical protein VX733_14790 [Candidatus Latescibacterota bacterium]|nr:hypothetical protein [Candidatus Latescibacterota bacterium]